MLTSADDLQLCVNKLKNLKFANQQKDILKGTYTLQDDSVVINLKRQSQQFSIKRRANAPDDSAITFTFFIELQIDGSTTKKKFNKLSWINYSVI